MARSKKPGGAGTERNSTSLPYTDQRQKTHEFANTRRTVRTSGKVEKLTNYQIMERKQFESGLAGNSIAQRDYLRRVELSEAARREHVEASCFLWSRIKAENQKAIEQARASGAPIPRVLPHPDDIIIDWEKGPKFLGPRIEEEWKIQMETVAIRDLLYIQQAMEDALDGVAMQNRPSHGGALMQAMVLNHMLAPSLRLSKSEEFDRCYRLKCRPQRELLKDCRMAWRSVGAPAKRGGRYGTAEALFPMLKAFANLCKASRLIEDDPLGFEEAIQTAVEAIVVFIQSAVAKQRQATGPGTGTPALL